VNEQNPNVVGPNVRLILSEGVRIVRGRVPAQVRKELSAAVKANALGHLRKDGLKPEVYFHPDHAEIARAKQGAEASQAIDRVGLVMVGQ
jgi:hypothetical protein